MLETGYQRRVPDVAASPHFPPRLLGRVAPLPPPTAHDTERANRITLQETGSHRQRALGEVTAACTVQLLRSEEEWFSLNPTVIVQPFSFSG